MQQPLTDSATALWKWIGIILARGRKKLDPQEATDALKCGIDRVVENLGELLAKGYLQLDEASRRIRVIGHPLVAAQVTSVEVMLDDYLFAVVENAAREWEDAEVVAFGIRTDPEGNIKASDEDPVLMAARRRMPGDSELILRLYDQGWAPTEKVAAAIVDLIQALSAYHIALGGSGLTIKDWETYVSANRTAEVGA